MSDFTVPSTRARTRPSLGAILWFVWMVALWLAFFALLFADRLDDLWRASLQLPLVVEIILWVLFLPWMLGMAIWTSTWADWLRMALVLCFAIGWTIVSYPRARKAHGSPASGQIE